MLYNITLLPLSMNAHDFLKQPRRLLVHTMIGDIVILTTGRMKSLDIPT